jgi:hypothetical protein
MACRPISKLISGAAPYSAATVLAQEVHESCESFEVTKA